jgi:hypothetical protein
MNLLGSRLREDGGTFPASPHVPPPFLTSFPFPAVTELFTPPLEDMILPGVTRDSVLALARDHASGKNKLEGLPDKFEVVEKNVTSASSPLVPSSREALD